MRTISETELRNIIRKHQLWIENEDGGEKADLSDADLCNADLHDVRLCEADLSNAYLRGANLRNAILSNANLSTADLCDADLYGADLYNVNLSYAYLKDVNLCETNLYDANLSYAHLGSSNLSNTNLSNANLYCADLRRANLGSANLSDASLRCANLYCANLYNADLQGADLRNVDLRSAKNIDTVFWNSFTTFYPIQCPESGAFVGYKKASRHIIKLEICEDALRSSATSRKCRCSKAKVLEIQNIDGSPSGLTSVASNYDPSFIYKVGEIVEVKDFDTNRWNECAPGIHFFMTRDEAVRYS